MRFHRALTAAVATAALAVPLVAASVPASAARQAPGVSARAGHKRGQPPARTPALPAPPGRHGATRACRPGTGHRRH